ncbi:MAG TPA: N-methyl-L-tryptophan oxidase [Planctomycetes bacterium]|nr:N-methyl-L-tryptophan oxidase [Planctomycetota bacterium]
MKTERDRRDFIKVCSASTLSALTAGLSETLAEEVADPSPAKPAYDCIVLGLGAMGSACVYQLAKRGASVLGIEQYDIAHALGSSGGISRQTKVMPYLGGPYEPLIRRANENWQSLEKDSGQKVFHPCGYLKLDVNQRLPKTVDRKKIELFDESKLGERFPQFKGLPRGTNGLFDHQGGLLRSELAIASHCHVALRQGAHIRAQEPVTGWTTDAESITVSTSRGRYRAKHLIIAAGAWNAKLVPQLHGKIQVTRLSLGWFAPKKPKSFSVASFPIWEHGSFYGFPVLPDFPGFKVAKHWRGDPTDPDKVDRRPNAADEKLVRDYLGRHIPSANGSVLAFKVCMYTHGGPWLGALPGEKRVSFIAACNGGGFKFSSAYGEALADLATQGRTDIPVGFMALR